MAHLWLSVFPQLRNRKVGSSVDKREKKLVTQFLSTCILLEDFESGAKKSCALLGRLRNNISIRKKPHVLVIIMDHVRMLSAIHQRHSSLCLGS